MTAKEADKIRSAINEMMRFIDAQDTDEKLQQAPDKLRDRLGKLGDMVGKMVDPKTL